MEKTNKTTKVAKVKQTPVFLVLYIIFAAIESSIWRERTAFFEQLLIIVLGLLVVTSSLYLIKNSIARFIVFALITVFAVLYNYRYAFCFVPVGALLSIYNELIAKEKENSILTKLYSAVFYIAVALGTTTVIYEIKDFEINSDFLNAIFIGVILVATFILALKNMKNDRRSFKKSTKKPYTTVLIMAVIGTIHTVIAYDVFLHNRIAFFPWFLFLCVLVYEKDACMVIFAKALIEKAERMLNTDKN